MRRIFLALLLLLTAALDVASAPRRAEPKSKVAAQKAAKAAAADSLDLPGERALSGRKVSRGVAEPAAAPPAEPEPEPDAGPDDGDPTLKDFVLCMDSVCASDDTEDMRDKGRCRCSNSLVRIEKVLRDIARIQNEADKEQKDLEILMNVSNAFEVQDILDSAYASIGSIEKKSRIMAANRLDHDALVAEGYPLQQYGLEKCMPALAGVDSDERDVRQKEYMGFIEKDCAAYTKVLAGRMDQVAGLVTQVRKNRELFYENEHKKINRLEYGACLAEYQGCASMECGVNFSDCIQSHRLYSMLQKCQAINYGACEDDKLKVIIDVKKYISKELRKVALAHECRRSLGSLVDGKCVFKIEFRADKCSQTNVFHAGCGANAPAKQLNPGGSTRCSMSSFGGIQKECLNSCYLVSADGTERYLGTDKDTSGGKTAGRVTVGILSFGATELFGAGAKMTCQSPKISVPHPAGWGSDGYPVDPELKEAMKGGGY